MQSARLRACLRAARKQAYSLKQARERIRACLRAPHRQAALRHPTRSRYCGGDALRHPIESERESRLCGIQGIARERLRSRRNIEPYGKREDRDCEYDARCERERESTLRRREARRGVYPKSSRSISVRRSEERR